MFLSFSATKTTMATSISQKHQPSSPSSAFYLPSHYLHPSLHCSSDVWPPQEEEVCLLCRWSSRCRCSTIVPHHRHLAISSFISSPQGQVQKVPWPIVSATQRLQQQPYSLHWRLPCFCLRQLRGTAVARACSGLQRLSVHTSRQHCRPCSLWLL